MSGVVRKLYAVLLALDKEESMTLPELRIELPECGREVLAAILQMKFRRGHLVRTGAFRHYAYRLSDEVRVWLMKEGIDAVRTRDLANFACTPARELDASPARKYVVYRALFNAPDGLTFMNAKLACPDVAPGFVAYSLSEAWTRGHVRRKQNEGSRSFTYWLDDGLRASIEELGIETAVAEAHRSFRAAAWAKPLPTSAQPQWPAFGTNPALPPVLYSSLPWHDEEEVPPCIGERYRDALRPRPRDD